MKKVPIYFRNSCLQAREIKISSGICGITKEFGLVGQDSGISSIEFEERSFRRVPLKHRAKITVKGGEKGWEDCTIRNINRNFKGMGIVFHAREEIPVNAVVIIDL